MNSIGGLPRAVIPPFVLTAPPVETESRLGRKFAEEEICDPENAPFLRPNGQRKRRGNPCHALPKIRTLEDLIESGESRGASTFQVHHARAMWEAGLRSKAARLVLCGRLGRKVHCVSHGHRFFVRYRCGNRYCQACMGAVFQALFSDLHARLAPIARRIVPFWPVVGRFPSRVIAKIDFTIPNDGQMPQPEMVRRFNKDIRKFFLMLARRKGWNKDRWGAAWCIEFGPGNTNLHAHGVYAGPWLQQKKREMSDLWSEIRGERSFLSVKAAHSFEHALRHAIKYPAADWKYLNSTPERLAALELAFNGIRRVHTVGAFYNPPQSEEQSANSGGLGLCPDCGSALCESSGWSWDSVSELESKGVRELDAARRQAGRTRTFGVVEPP
jgi:hypothetical protein